MGTIIGWHRGEASVRQKLGYDHIPSIARLFDSISGEMPAQHAEFYSTRIPFLPITSLDEDGRPWGSILAGLNGQTGFVHNPRYNTLVIDAELWDGEPFLETVKNLERESESILIAGIGVEVSTRRRNKFAGNARVLQKVEKSVQIELVVTQAIGNCPKYITLRDLVPHLQSSPTLAYQERHLSLEATLPDEVISFVHESDTTFLGTTYSATAAESQWYPSHVGMNHRGGRPGFTRVKLSDRRTVVLPDFSGNRIMTSMGNVEATPFASLTFICFITGDILYLTGNARNVYGTKAHSIMPFQDALTEIFVTGYILVRDALPVRQRPGVEIQRSPYSPSVKFLAEEGPQLQLFSKEDQPKALLTSIAVHCPTIASFEWESPTPLRIKPGQAIIMDFKTLLGPRQYKHMSPSNPILVNDDFIRTWTVSSYTDDPSSRLFSLTMRRKPGGTVTSSLFDIANKLAKYKPEALGDSRELGLMVNIVGVTGEFHLPSSGNSGKDTIGKEEHIRNMVWIAGGIGVTPFLSMLTALKRSADRVRYSIILILSTKEPDIILSLISPIVEQAEDLPHMRLDFSVHLFTDTLAVDSGMELVQHFGRVNPEFFTQNHEMFKRAASDIYLCGPEGFEIGVLNALEGIGIHIGTVHRERFAY
ncbi:hypothetical protein B0H34DRAFT_667640 [Crassisporium funariophilum]|nr:hypothetical protein B0H34DRAFT_667640 [Crassisporium funariophilum]